MQKALNRILFLQLPRLENSNSVEEENIPLAGFYLADSLKRADMERGYVFRFLEPEEETLDDGHLVDIIAGWRPDAVCATLYLWNVEHTISVLKRIREMCPGIVIICGGPEAAPDHPFLFKEHVVDVLVMGEGEGVFPGIIRSFQDGNRPDLKQVAWRTKRGYTFGKGEAPAHELKRMLPEPDDPGWRPDAQGMAYMETGRGCPMRCTYCRYPQMRRRPVFLEVDDVLYRVRVLRQRGANQIRFIDPTFNANPGFRRILEGLKLINRDGQVRFFAELHADILDKDDIMALAEAGFSEIEAGVQSMDREVLRLIRRPTGTDRLEANIRLMTEAGIRVTVDLMYGLPGQRLEDVISSFGWAKRFRNSHVQCMQTLLLPGTELREMKDTWKIRAGERPPYEVRSTSTLSPEDVCIIEELLNKKHAAEAMTRRFTGYRLPDLFNERVDVSPEISSGDGLIEGRTSKRAVIFRGKDLYGKRRGILDVIGRAVSHEPHMLWQFVIMPEEEEPLDLLKDMIRAIREFPSHWLDRFAHASCWERIASRRVFVQLKRNRSYSHEWIQACEALLEDHFY